MELRNKFRRNSNKAESNYISIDQDGNVKSSRYDTLRSELKLEPDSSSEDSFRLSFRDPSKCEFNRYLTYWNTKYSRSKVQKKPNLKSLFIIVPVEVEETSESAQKFKSAQEDLKKYTVPNNFFRIKNQSLKHNSFLAVNQSNMALHYTSPSDGKDIAMDEVKSLDMVEYGSDLWYFIPSPDHPNTYALKNVATDLYIAIDGKNKGYLRLDHKLTPESYINLNDGHESLSQLSEDKKLSGQDVKFMGSGDARYTYYLTYSSKNCNHVTTRSRGGRWSKYEIYVANDFDLLRQRYDEMLYNSRLNNSVIGRYNAYVGVVEELMKIAETYKSKNKNFKKAKVAGAAIGVAGAAVATSAVILGIALTGPVAPLIVGGVATGISATGSSVGVANSVSKGRYENARQTAIQRNLNQINIHDQRFKDHFNLLLIKDLRYGKSFNGLKNTVLDAKSFYVNIKKLAYLVPETITNVKEVRLNSLIAEDLSATENGELAQLSVKEATGASAEVISGSEEVAIELGGIEEMVFEGLQNAFGDVSQAAFELASDVVGTGLSSLFLGLRIHSLVKASADLADQNPDAATEIMYSIIKYLHKTLRLMEQAIFDLQAYETNTDEEEIKRFANAQEMAHSRRWLLKLQNIDQSLTTTERDRSPELTPEDFVVPENLNKLDVEEGQKFIFQHKWKGKFLSAKKSDENGFIGLSENPFSLETFEIEYSQEIQDSLYLKSDDGTYLGMRPDGSLYLTDNRGTWESFFILKNEKEEDTIQIYSPVHRLYIHLEYGEVYATTEQRSLATLFKLRDANAVGLQNPGFQESVGKYIEKVVRIRNLKTGCYFSSCQGKTDSGTENVQYDFNDKDDKLFSIVPSQEDQNSYLIQSAKDTKKVVEVKKNQDFNGNSTVLFGMNGKSNQQFCFIPEQINGENCVRMVSKSCNKSLDVQHDYTGSRIHTWDWHDGDSQKWVFESTEDDAEDSELSEEKFWERAVPNANVLEFVRRGSVVQIHNKNGSYLNELGNITTDENHEGTHWIIEKPEGSHFIALKNALTGHYLSLDLANYDQYKAERHGTRWWPHGPDHPEQKFILDKQGSSFSIRSVSRPDRFLSEDLSDSEACFFKNQRGWLKENKSHWTIKHLFDLDS